MKNIYDAGTNNWYAAEEYINAYDALDSHVSKIEDALFKKTKTVSFAPNSPLVVELRTLRNEMRNALHLDDNPSDILRKLHVYRTKALSFTKFFITENQNRHFANPIANFFSKALKIITFGRVNLKSPFISEIKSSLTKFEDKTCKSFKSSYFQKPKNISVEELFKDKVVVEETKTEIKMTRKPHPAAREVEPPSSFRPGR